MGCGPSSVSKPRPKNAGGNTPTTRAAAAAAAGRRAGGEDPENAEQDRVYSQYNGGLWPTERRLSLVSEGSEDELCVNELLQGNARLARDNTTRIVRIFTSSTFTDTQHERNALMERVYPRLKEFCAELGYNFQVVDMRWGLRDEAADDHSTTDLCLRELRACQRLSTGPNFVTFLSHKYGYRPLPRTINANQFELIMSGITDPESRNLMEKWYIRDDNALPAAYVLQPISSNIPEFRSSDPEVFGKAKATWWQQNELMQEMLASAAQQTLTDAAESHRFVQSVTETEIEAGILKSPAPDQHCLWFYRRIDGIEKPKPDKLLSRYTDGHDENKRQLMENLTSNLLNRNLPRESIHSYLVPWTSKAIDPSGCRKHAEYINQLCTDFEAHIKLQVKAGIAKRNQSTMVDPLINEVSQHALFCQSKRDNFHGRQNMMDQVESYLMGNSRYPLVIHGESGCGKTSVMAMAAERTWELYKGKALVVLRFIGTTPDSSSIRTLLLSIITQIRRLFTEDEKIATDYKSLVDEFDTALHLASKEQPFVFILDSLDQFSLEHNARQLCWLPSKLPNHVKMLLSSLPGAEYECFPRLKAILRDDRHFLSVPRLGMADTDAIMTSLLSRHGRCLRQEQKDLVLQAFTQCPLPLYLKLCFDEAVRWPSYQPVSDSHLQDTIQGVIRTLFSRMEASHGRLLVSHSLGCLTLSRSGLSEPELEDILSCDDDVLNDVYQFWVPPIRRLPPLLLIRVKADLQPYLVDRGADGSTVTYWYHRQFIEAAHACYCSDKETRTLLHTNIAEYFRGIWAETPKPYVDGKTGKTDSALRHVSRQPLKFYRRFNLRKLMELPRHLVEAEQLTVLKEELLFCLEWLTAKIEATSLRHVIDDFEVARAKFPDDEDLKTVCEVLQLSQDALNSDPHQLPGQLIGRILHGNNKLTAQCCRPSYPALIPSEVILTPPGGQLIHVLPEHTNDINSLDLSQDGKMAVTCADDHTVKLWDVTKGKLDKSYDNVGDQPHKVRFCCGDTAVVVVDTNHLFIISLETGETRVLDNPKIKIVGRNINHFLVLADGETLVVPHQKSLHMIELPSGSHSYSIKDTFMRAVDNYGSFSDIIDGHHNIIGITTAGALNSDIHYTVHIADLRQRKFTHSVVLFSKPANEDDQDYTVDALAVTHDDQYIIAAEMFTNSLYFISAEDGQVLRKLEGNEKDCSNMFHITPDNLFLYFSNMDHMCLCNLETGERSYTLRHAGNAGDIHTVNQKTYVSYSGDSVCIWDIERMDVHQHSDPDSTGESKQHKLSKLLMLSDTDRYILIHKTPKAADHHLVQIYDVLQETYVRSLKLKEFTHSAKVTKDHRLVWVKDRRVMVLNLQNNQYIVCQGKLPTYNTDLDLAKEKPYLVTFSQNRMKLKVFNWTTGKVQFFLEGNQSHKLDDLKISASGTIAATMGDKWPILVFNVETRRQILELTLDADVYTSMNQFQLSEDGSRLIHQVLREGEDVGVSSQMDYMVAVDVASGAELHHQVDWDAYRIVSEDHTDTDLSVSVFLIWKHYVISSHYDNRIRVWDTNKAEMLHSLAYPSSEPVSYMYLTTDETRLVTAGDRGQLVIWDTATWHQVASFMADNAEATNSIRPMGDGSVIVLRDEKQGKLTQLRLVGEGMKAKKDQGKLKEIFQANAKLDEELIIVEIPATVDDGDPDTEAEVLSDEESDSQGDNNSFDMKSDPAGLSQDSSIGDAAFDIDDLNNLDMYDIDQYNDDLADETKTRSTTLIDSIGMKSSAKSRFSEK